MTPQKHQRQCFWPTPYIRWTRGQLFCRHLLEKFKITPSYPYYSPMIYSGRLKCNATAFLTMRSKLLFSSTFVISNVRMRVDSYSTFSFLLSHCGSQGTFRLTVITLSFKLPLDRTRWISALKSNFLFTKVQFIVQFIYRCIYALLLFFFIQKASDRI